MHVKLSAKKLYQADGQAVQELLKLLALLYTVNPYSKELNGSLVATDSETDNETISQMLTKVSDKI